MPHTDTFADALMAYADAPDDEQKGEPWNVYRCPKCGQDSFYGGIPAKGLRFRGSGQCEKCGYRQSIVGTGMKPVGQVNFAETTDDAPAPGSDLNTTALLALVDARLKGHEDLAKAIMGMMQHHPEELQGLTVDSHADDVDAPAVEQDDGWDCGPAALASAIGSFGVDVSPDDLANELGTTPHDGTPPEAMLDACKRLGIVADGRERLSIEDLEQAADEDSPVIVCMQANSSDPEDRQHLNAGHWVVVVGVDKEAGIIHLMDPELPEEANPVDMRATDFEKRWVDRDAGGKVYVRFGIVVRDVDLSEEPEATAHAETPWEAFSAEDWTQQQGPRGGHQWVNRKTGQVEYGATNPGGDGKSSAAAPATAPAPSGTTSSAAPAAPIKSGGLLSKIISAISGKKAATAPLEPYQAPKEPFPTSEQLGSGKIEVLGGTSLHGNNLGGDTGGVAKITVGDKPYFFKAIDKSQMPVLKRIVDGKPEEVPDAPFERGSAEKEVATSKALLSLGVAAPRAELTAVKGQKGVVCDWTGATEGSKASFRGVSHADMTKALLGSYLLGIKDRHLGNYMVGKDNRLFSIDHEFSMHETEPDADALFNGVYKNGLRKEMRSKQFDSGAIKDIVDAAPALVESLKTTNPAAAAMIERRAGHLAKFIATGKHTFESLDQTVFTHSRAQAGQ